MLLSAMEALRPQCLPICKSRSSTKSSTLSSAASRFLDVFSTSLPFIEHHLHLGGELVFVTQVAGRGFLDVPVGNVAAVLLRGLCSTRSIEQPPVSDSCSVLKASHGSLRRCSSVRRIIQDMADINDIHLPPQTFMGRIDGYHPSIAAEPWMRIDPVFAI